MPNNPLCEKLSLPRFTVAAQKHPLSAALVLASVYVMLKNNVQDTQALSEALSALKKNIDPDSVNRIWNAVNNISAEKLKTLAHHKESIPLLKKNLICDIDFSKNIDKKSLIELAGDPLYYPMVFIAFVRRGLLEHNANDPISQGKTDCNALLEDFYQKNYPGIYRFLQQCPHFPEEDFVSLAKTHEKLVDRIMEDIRGCVWEASLLFRFATLFPEKQADIAGKYQNTFDTTPLTPEKEEVLKAQLHDLKKKAPEAFSSVKTDRKVDLDPPQTPKTKSRYFDPKRIFQATAGIAGAGVGALGQQGTIYVFGTKAIFQSAAVLSPALAPIAAPIIVAGIGVGIATAMNKSGASDAIGKATAAQAKLTSEVLNAAIGDTADIDEMTRDVIRFVSGAMPKLFK